jgi:hypothetical protein
MSERLTQVTVVTKSVHTLRAGEMTHETRADQSQCWYIGCPQCSPGVGNLGFHTVTEDEQGITVSPSILCGCGAHYFIERNQIRWC